MHLYNAAGPLVSGNNLGGFFVYNFGLSVVINTNNITLTNHGYNLGSTSSTVVGKYVDSNKIGTIYVAYLIFATSV